MSQPPITSLTNPRVKAVVRLRDRAERDLTGLTIVDGAREILRALDAGVRVEQAFVASDLLRSADGQEVADRLRHRPTTLEVSPAVLARVAFGQRSDGVVAVVATPSLSLDDLVKGDNTFFAATGVTDGDLLRGVRYQRGGARTHSLVMRSKSGTVRTLQATHSMDKLVELAGDRYS